MQYSIYLDTILVSFFKKTIKNPASRPRLTGFVVNLNFQEKINMTTLAQNQSFEQTAIVAFNGASLVTAKIKEIIYVAMRPIVEAIGLDWAGQTVKLNKNKERYGCCVIATPSNGGIQDMLFIPLRKLNGWLFSINPEKVRPDLKETVIQYQEECFEVLYSYWTKGVAINPRPQQLNLPTMSDKRTRVPLKDAVTLLVAKSRNMSYSDAYSLIHQRFDVDSVEDLTNEQIPLAVEYVHRVIGEFIGKDALPAPKPVLIADFPKKCVFEHKFPQRHLLTLDVFYDGYGLQGNPLRRLFALLKQAQKDGSTVAVNDIQGAELVLSVTEAIAKQYKDALEQLSRNALSNSNQGCYLPIQGC